MNAVIPFAFEEQLVRVVKRGEDPWFVGRDVCRVLDIRNESDALKALDDDEKEAGVGITDPSGTKYAIIVSEPGVYRLVFRSRKPQAERFKRWLAHEVLPSIRKTGQYGTGDQAEPRPQARRLEPSTYSEALDTVREIRFTAGREAARLAWNRLGLPALPVVAPTLKDEARECLRHLLGAPLAAGGAVSIGTAIDWGLRDEESYAMDLEEAGIRLFREIDAVFVANSHPRLEEIFEGTNWFSWYRVLRRLPGASVSSTVKLAGKAHRGTIIPASELDFETHVSSAGAAA